MEQIDLHLKRKDTQCEIFVGFGVLEFLVDDLKARPMGHRLGIVTDRHVARLWGRRLHSLLVDAGLRTDMMVIQPGEASKKWGALARIFGWLVKQGFDRTSCLIALGGGVVGDVTGFVASVYMRSIPYIQVPTTLLAQVDSSMGGKNGVDLPHGKNLIGTVYQPERVYIDPSVLGSLPHAEFQHGLAEVIKSAIIRDGEFFQFLEHHHDAIVTHESKALEKIISRCCRIKTEVVMADEHDRGIRRLLNFGHTVGHAIETLSGYTIPHGMAVSMGMAAETALSTREEKLVSKDRTRIIEVLERYGLPTHIPGHHDSDALLALMGADKKTENGRIAVILPTSVGTAIVREGVPRASFREALREVQP